MRAPKARVGKAVRAPRAPAWCAHDSRRCSCLERQPSKRALRRQFLFLQQRAEDASELVQVAGDGVNWILAKIGSRQAQQGRRAARVGGGGGRATLGAWPLARVGSCRLDGILAVCMRRSQYLGDCFFASIFAHSYLDSEAQGGRERPCPGESETRARWPQRPSGSIPASRDTQRAGTTALGGARGGGCCG